MCLEEIKKQYKESFGENPEHEKETKVGEDLSTSHGSLKKNADKKSIVSDVNEQLSYYEKISRCTKALYRF